LAKGLSGTYEHSSFAEASLDPEWQESMNVELAALTANDTWDYVKLPPGTRAIPCKWAYKVKHRSDGIIERLKGQLVICGNTQE